MRIEIDTWKLDQMVRQLNTIANVENVRGNSEFIAAYEKLISEWGEVAVEHTRAALNRPHWLLSKRMAAVTRNYGGRVDKVWSYRKQKFFTAIGVAYENDSDARNPRSPVYYGVYQARKRGFYKQARRTAVPILEKRIAQEGDALARRFFKQTNFVRNYIN